MTASGPRVLSALVAAAAAPRPGRNGSRATRTTLAGETMSYHSPYPDITSALLVRATDGTMAIEWETEPVPAGLTGRPPLSSGWPAWPPARAPIASTWPSTGGRALSFRTSDDSTRGRMAGDRGGRHLAVLQDDHGRSVRRALRLHVPRSSRRPVLRPGRPLRLKVTGEKAGSHDWFMVFRDDLRRDVWAKSEQALVRKDGRLFQLVRVEISHIAPPAKAVVSCAEAADRQPRPKRATTPCNSPCPRSKRNASVPIEVAWRTARVLPREASSLRPVVPREIWLLPHSHVDIGYSDLQTVVEKNHWRYSEKRSSCPPHRRVPARRALQMEHRESWAVESYFRQAGAG